MKNNLGILVLAAVVAVVGFANLQKDPVVVNVESDGTVSTNLGANPGPDFTNHVEFKSGMSEGGVFTISTTSSAFTLTDHDMSDSKVISVSSVAGAAALALTLPASSTWASLPNNGVAQEWIVDNLHTAAATTTTITAGAGVDIDGTTADDDIINGGVSGRLQCWRLPSSDIRCIVEEMVDAG